jgi:hypothetical protein
VSERPTCRKSKRDAEAVRNFFAANAEAVREFWESWAADAEAVRNFFAANRPKRRKGAKRQERKLE